MNSLLVHFNDDRTIRFAAFRVNNQKVPSFTIMELFEIYQRLIAQGVKPIVTIDPDDGTELQLLMF